MAERTVEIEAISGLRLSVRAGPFGKEYRMSRIILLLVKEIIQI